MTSKNYIPWVEKYRPIEFTEIVLDDFNKIIFNNILGSNYFPNLLLYGPPGTGKTTTVINLINTYQKNNNEKNKGLMIHLNASDERGIDIIRNQINSFVNSKTIFSKGVKFIVLDEVDYMTKNAQQALKYSLQEYKENVRFCLICNYISKIDDSLQNELVRIRFNQLPKTGIIKFLDNINKNENLNLSKDHIESIQNTFKSDIRSMINYMQTNQLAIKNTKVLNDEIYNSISVLIQKQDFKQFYNQLIRMSEIYNIDQKNLIKCYFNYLIRNQPQFINTTILNYFEFIMHNPDSNVGHQIKLLFFILKFN